MLFNWFGEKKSTGFENFLKLKILPKANKISIL